MGFEQKPCELGPISAGTKADGSLNSLGERLDYRGASQAQVDGCGGAARRRRVARANELDQELTGRLLDPVECLVSLLDVLQVVANWLGAWQADHREARVRYGVRPVLGLVPVCRLNFGIRLDIQELSGDRPVGSTACEAPGRM